eukprot:CAMPEP_0178917252 /NCGR_PEP_ID=MMETSP0786-20121207/13141_1 /TAXON_ID=186022 /ORGANISM="Thalassionema frauenfeldii, Strain CCMP 1798" /LENGTH=231 /DNA_ID=CAMNT_0020590777 /DNA_START=54 /DNA_END=746 /DNA_ORIENTATION=+
MSSLLVLPEVEAFAVPKTRSASRVLIPPVPGKQTKTKKELERSVECDDDDNEADCAPNWIFLYPKACSCLFPNHEGACVGSSVKDIPPDSCTGGYYGHSDLDPEQVMKEGLLQRGDDWDLLHHAEQRGNSAFRGTTTQITYPDGNGAASWAGEGGCVYELTCVPTWDVNKHLQGRRLVSEWAVGKDRFGGNLALGEHEFAVSSRVPPEHIKRYGRVVESANGLLYVPRNSW